jgi:hypothetical protein
MAFPWTMFLSSARTRATNPPPAPAAPPFASPPARTASMMPVTIWDFPTLDAAARYWSRRASHKARNRRFPSAAKDVRRAIGEVHRASSGSSASSRALVGDRNGLWYQPIAPSRPNALGILTYRDCSILFLQQCNGNQRKSEPTCVRDVLVVGVRRGCCCCDDDDDNNNNNNNNNNRTGDPLVRAQPFERLACSLTRITAATISSRK